MAKEYWVNVYNKVGQGCIKFPNRREAILLCERQQMFKILYRIHVKMKPLIQDATKSRVATFPVSRPNYKNSDGKWMDF